MNTAPCRVVSEQGEGGHQIDADGEATTLLLGTIEGMSPKHPIAGCALVLRSECALDRSGQAYLALTLRCADGGCVKARWWRYPYPVDRKPLVGTVCWFKGTIDVYVGERQLCVTQARPTPHVDARLFVRPTRRAVAELLAELDAKIATLAPDLSNLVRSVLSDDVRERFCEWPAAQARHGAVRHGLLIPAPPFVSRISRGWYRLTAHSGSQPTVRKDEATSLARRYCSPEERLCRKLRSLHAKGITMAASNKLSFGIKTRPQWTTYDDLVQVWREADGEPRFEHAWLFDHFQPLGPDPTGPCLEGWTLLAALAAQTTRLRLGVMVTGITYRHPAVLANMAATVDHISHGRLDLGIGASWNEAEHTSYGIPFYPAGERLRRLGKAFEVIRLLWTEQTATFAGQYYQLAEARCEPKPVQRPHPPVVIGGHGERLTLRVVAQHADMWNTIPETAEDYRRKCAALEAHCAATGRNPTTIERSVQVLADLSHPEVTCEFVAALITAGARHIVVEIRPPFPPGIVRHVAEVIVEPVRMRMGDAGVGGGG